MGKYRLYCVVNNVPEQKVLAALDAYRDSLFSKLQIELVYTLVQVDEPVQWFYAKPYYGLNFNVTDKYSSEAVGFHGIKYFYDPVALQAPFAAIDMASWTYVRSGKPQVQVICRPEFDDAAIARILEHEGVHDMFGNLREKGINLVDTADVGGQMDLDDEFDVLRPYAEKICEPMPIDSKLAIWILLIKLLRQAIAMFMTKAVTFRQLAEAMAQFEGFYIAGSVAQRNHNPDNLKYAGQPSAIGADPRGFCIFPDDPAGWNACILQMKLMAGKIPGRQSTSGLTGTSTVDLFIRTWCKGDSGTIQENYINHVCTTLGITPDFQIGNFVS